MKVYLVSRPAIENETISAFLKSEEQSWQRTRGVSQGEDLIELAARICYMSFGDRQCTKSNRDYIEHLIAEGHESVLEHAAWTFIVTGITRSFTHQLVRHRIGFSYSQLSQQYHDQKSSEFVEPIRLDENARTEWERAMQAARTAYSNITNLMEKQYRNELEEGDEHSKREIKRLIRSTARSVLPNCTETKIVFSANGRSIRNLLKLRGSIVGDLEMRLFCHELLLIMKREAKNLFGDFMASTHHDGYPIIFQNKEV